MIQKIMFQNRNSVLAKRNIEAVSLLFLLVFLIQLPLYSQTKPDIMSKAVQDSSKDITIHQEVDFNVSPKKLYEALLSSKEFSAVA